MGKSVRPDFNAEETLSVQKDKREIRRIIQEMAEYLPQEDPEKGVYIQLLYICLLYTSPSPRDLSTSRMPSSA